MNILDSLTAHEAFLAGALGPELVTDGLIAKRRRMRENPFAFLRGTYWRWAETMPELLGDRAGTPEVLAVGDIHLENYGTWRDAEGRLVWGVNDFDEAAEMPYLLDPLRLATSARLARGQAAEPATAAIAGAILAGYADGLRTPGPCVLDRDKTLKDLRGAVAVPERDREDFWDGLDKKQKRFRESGAGRPALRSRYRDALRAALPPGAVADDADMFYREAGLGSLGRPRWVVRAQWRGDAVIREAKGLTASAWTWLRGDRNGTLRCLEIATGRYRAPDPWYDVTDGIAVRRLSPNNRKIEAGERFDGSLGGGAEKTLGRDVLLTDWMLRLMGRDLASIHLGAGGADTAMAGRIRDDLDRRGRDDGNWLAALTERAARDILADYETFRKA